MTEKYEVQNITRGPISFQIFTPYTIPEGMPKHKRKKLIKGSAQNIIIPTQQIRDLVEVTGLSIADLKNQPELNKILRGNLQRLRLLTDIKPVEEPTEEPKPKEPTEEPKVEEVPAGAPPASAPPVEEPKPVETPVVPAGTPPVVAATPAGGPPVGAPPMGKPPVGAPPAGSPPSGTPVTEDPTRKIETEKK